MVGLKAHLRDIELLDEFSVYTQRIFGQDHAVFGLSHHRRKIGDGYVDAIPIHFGDRWVIGVHALFEVALHAIRHPNSFVCNDVERFRELQSVEGFGDVELRVGDRFGFSHIREQKLTACFLPYLDVNKLKTLVQAEKGVTLVNGNAVVLS